jgi:hypothetical protein
VKPDLVCLADVEARSVEWLWEPFIPLRMLSILSGDPGAGKSYIALKLAADLSRGGISDGRTVEPANTLYLTCENPIAESIRPRFDLLEGDPNRLMMLLGVRVDMENGEEKRRAVTLGNVDALGAAIRESSARLVVVDPIQSYLGASVDLHRSNETRPVMDGLARLADEHGCAILLLRHLSKMAGGKAIHRGLGSIDLTGAARSEMLAGALPDDPERRALIHVKANVGRLGRSRGYAINGDGRFTWTGDSSITAADLLASPTGPGDGKLIEATQWLTDLLGTGKREGKEVCALAETAGISAATLRRAKNATRVRSSKVGTSGPWMWSLPEDARHPAEDAQDAQRENVSTFGGVCGGLLQ